MIALQVPFRAHAASGGFYQISRKISPGDQIFLVRSLTGKKGKPVDFPFSKNLERETSLELATSTLARLRSTN